VSVVALADFGSTYTKVALVDPAEGRLLARAQAPTSVATDLIEGYAVALRSALASVGGGTEIARELAVSSAGGGLRVAAVGLVADLTAAAARQAALNAGARVEAVVSGALGEGQLDQLQAARPEIVLFAGGTDGGQADLVAENARRLARREFGSHAVVACNREVAGEVAAILRGAGWPVEVAANVMPELGRLEIESARETILRVFLAHVIGGKGLSASREFERMVKMPTPEAVLVATRLLSHGSSDRPGIGDVVVVDVGGATTDVHSSRAVLPASPGVEDPLLPPPSTLRTVEGDLGLRSGAAGVMAVDGRWIESERAGVDPPNRQTVSIRVDDPVWMPREREEVRLDGLLAIACATQGLARHSGSMLLARAATGPPTLVRQGPDLREVRQVIGTGGVFAHRADGEEILTRALGRQTARSLAPREPKVCVDSGYVMAAAGLLASEDPSGALRLLLRELAVP
jgi:uncharacterized protein (TIGR01319 family)